MGAENAGAGMEPGEAKQPGLLGQVLRIWQVSTYLALYVVLIVAYVVCESGKGQTLPAQQWLAAYAAMSAQGKSADPAVTGLRVLKPVDFQASGGPAVSLQEGNRITPNIAAELAKAMRAEKFHEKELTLYKEGWFWNLPWAQIFTVYNLLGMFGALFLGLRKPVTALLDTTAHTTEQDLLDARAAKAEAESLKQKYDTMLAALEQEKQQFAKTLAEEEELERMRIMQAARHEAAGIVESVKQSIESEVQQAAARLRTEVVRQALDLARQRLASEASAEQHKKLFSEFIGDLERLEK